MLHSQLQRMPAVHSQSSQDHWTPSKGLAQELNLTRTHAVAAALTPWAAEDAGFCCTRFCTRAAFRAVEEVALRASPVAQSEGAWRIRTKKAAKLTHEHESCSCCGGSACLCCQR